VDQSIDYSKLIREPWLGPSEELNLKIERDPRNRIKDKFDLSLHRYLPRTSTNTQMKEQLNLFRKGGYLGKV
jgi:hypothetical protein